MGATQWRDVRLYQHSGWGLSLFFAIGTSMLSVALIEFTSMIVKQQAGQTNEKLFELFFGDGALSRAVRGVIILQADQIETLMDELATTDALIKDAMHRALNQPENNRLFKARSWVNARDAEAARFLREKIRKAGFPTPDLEIIQHEKNTDPPTDPFKKFASAPYVISMGLAFTDTTTAIANDIAGPEKCIRIDRASELGDAVVLRATHVSGEYADLDTSDVRVENDSGIERRYTHIYPKGKWTIDKWLNHEKGLKDYGLIVRHTVPVGNGTQVRFVLAGFTEDSTVEAARYFILKWESLAKEAIKLKSDEGDFIAIVSGELNDDQSWLTKPAIMVRHDEIKAS